MINRRRVLRALGAFPLLSIIPAVARARAVTSLGALGRDHYCGTELLSRTRELLDFVSVARQCLPIRAQLARDRLRVVAEVVVGPGEKPALGTAYDSSDPSRTYRSVFRAEVQDIDLDDVDAARKVLTAFVVAEERLFLDMLRSTRTPMVQIEDMGDLHPGATRGLDRLRHALERHDVPADKLYVSDEDFPWLRERWAASFQDDADLRPHQRLAGEPSRTGFRGLLLGHLHVMTRSSLVLEPFVRPGEAWMMTRPEFLGRFYDNVMLSRTADSPNAQDSTKDRWVSSYGVTVVPFRAYRARFPSPRA